MRAFITGATGFLGSNLADTIKCPVVSLVRDQGTIIPKSTTCYGDLSDLPRLERILAEYQIDTVFHLAAQTEVGTAVRDPIGTWETNIRGTWNMLEACRRQKVKRIIVSSSDKAYGRTEPPYLEDLPLRPDRPYETSKACVDLISRTYAATYGMSIAVTRCTNLYGPGCLTLSTLIPNTIRRILRGERPIIRNCGRMKRDWLYIGDAVEAYLQLASSEYVGAMNFGTGEAVTVADTVKLILELMDSDLEPIDEKDLHGEIVDQWTDASLAFRELGWAPCMNLRDGLDRTIDWYIDNQER